jgi:hypothetical protein
MLEATAACNSSIPCRTRVAVVAIRYREPLEQLTWLDAVADHAFLINKGDPLQHEFSPSVSVIAKQNRGRESYSYLDFLHSQAGQQATSSGGFDVLVFTQANPLDWRTRRWPTSRRLSSWVAAMRGHTAPSPCFSCFGPVYKLSMGARAHRPNASAIHALSLDNFVCPEINGHARAGIRFCPGATFAVSRELLHSLSRDQLHDIASKIEGSCAKEYWQADPRIQCHLEFEMERLWQPFMTGCANHTIAECQRYDHSAQLNSIG